MRSTILSPVLRKTPPDHTSSLLQHGSHHLIRGADHHGQQVLSGPDGCNDDDLPITPPGQRICCWTIYTVHALCTWDERLYEFASYLFLFKIFKTTLFLPSIYGFLTTVTGILFSTSIGTLVDRTPRLQAVRSFLLTQKLCSVLGGICFWALLTYFDPSDLDRNIMSAEMGYSIFCLLVLLSGLLKLSALGWSISIERDWIVVLCEGDSHLLTRINVCMKRIDLVCKLASPLVLAGCLAWWSIEWCSLLIAVWCTLSLGLEWLLVLRIWNSSEALWQPREVAVGGDPAAFKDSVSPRPKVRASILRHNSQHGFPSSEPLVVEDHSWRRDAQLLASASSEASFAQDPQDDLENQRLLKKSHQQHSRWYFLKSFGGYYYHSVFLASLSYGIIYINMISVSGTMIGYLQWQGFTPSTIAVLKGVCTAAELLGTIIMPVLTHYIGLVRAGSWSIWFEVLALTPVMLAIYSNRVPIQLIIFAGMALSRIGVWSFDLVITQIMQEHIDNDGAGIINGWHYTMMNTFELAQFMLTMIWYDPEQYLVPALISYVCVVVGAIVYTTYLMRMRGHLFHYHRLATSAPPAFLVSQTDAHEADDDS